MVARALDFPLGRPVIPAARVRQRRDLPPNAHALVRIGEQVSAEQPIAEVVTPGGTLTILAGLPGAVSDVGQEYVAVEGLATILQSPVGVGGVAIGPLVSVSTTESSALVPIPRGAILVYPACVPLTLLQRAAAGGAAGIIAASAVALELEAFTRTDLSVVLDGLTDDQARLPLSILLTEGFGDVPMLPAVQSLLASRTGTLAMLSGATNPRQNLRAEALLTVPPAAQAAALPADTTLEVGTRVRVYAGSHRGMEGVIAYLFTAPQLSETGQLLPSAQLQLERGGTCVVPLALLDRLA